MRLFTVGAALLLSISTTAVAQSRWTFSAGPEWTPFSPGRFYGARVRAEYDLIKPTGPLRLRLETAGFWSPTQSFYGRYFLVDGTFGGERQLFDLTFGLSAAITPLPKARFSPYLTMSAVARQTWRRGSSWVQYADSSAPQFFPLTTASFGDVLLEPGIGIRARIAGRVFQLEWRHYDHRSLTLGTHLPF